MWANVSVFGDSHRTVIEAHRGDSSRAPENTMAAFNRAIQLGVRSIELDVHPAGDGTLMVIHDDTVDRTTNGSGRVCEMTVDELLRLDAGSSFSAGFAGERIPQFADVLDRVASTEVRLNVEVKACPRDVDVPAAVVSHLRRAGAERRDVVSSFDLDTLLRIRALADEIDVALIGQGPEVLQAALRHRLPWIHGHHETVDQALVEVAHANGIRVNVWTVDDASRFVQWRRMGVDKVCTNRPAEMLAAANWLPASS